MSPHCLGFRMLRGQQRTRRNGIVFIVFLEFVTIIYIKDNLDEQRIMKNINLFKEKLKL